MTRHIFTTLALFSAFFLFQIQDSFGVTVTSSHGGGNWNNAGSWDIGVPNPGDDVVISSGNPITVQSGLAVTINSITINPGAALTLTGTIDCASSFTANGSWTGSGRLNFWTAIASTYTLAGSYNVNFSGLIVAYANTLNISAGVNFTKIGSMTLYTGGVTVNNSGNVTVGTLFLNAGCTWNNMNGSALSVSANIGGTGTLSASTATNTVTYLPGATSIVSATYSNLSLLANTSIYFPADLNVNNNLTISSGTALNPNGFKLYLGGNFTNNCTSSNVSLLDIIFNGAGASNQTLTKATSANETFNTLTISRGAGTGKVVLGSSVLILNNTLTINSGTLDASVNNPIITLYGDWVNNGGTFTPGTSAVQLCSSSINAKIGKTGGGTETFGPLQQYYTGTYTLTSDISLSNLTIVSGTLAGSTFNITLSGNWNNSGGTFSPGTSTVIFAPTGSQTISKGAGTETFNNLTKNTANTTTLANPISCAGAFTLNAGSFDVSSSNYAVSIGGNVTMNANLNFHTGTVTLNGATPQALTGGALSFYNLTSTGSHVTLGNNTTVTNNFLLSSGIFDLGSTSEYLGIAGSATFNGTFTPQSNDVYLNGTTNQSLNATVATNFYNLGSYNYAGATFSSGTYTITNSLICKYPGAVMTQAGGSSITLAANAASNAYIGNGSGTFAGTYHCQRWTPNPGQGNWADIGTTVSNNTVNDWDSQFFISGVGGINGTASGFNSFTLYNETLSSNNYTAITSTAYPLAPGVGYTVWLADTYSPATWNAKTITCDGIPNAGNIASPSLTFTGGSTDPGENHVSNPYASHITWDASGTNITKAGNVDLSTIYVLSNGNYVAHGNGFDLPCGQGFIIYATGAGSNSITFKENSKNTSTASTFDFREAAPYNLKLKLSTNTLPDLFQEITVNFDEHATLGFETPYDARYIESPVKKAPGLYMVQDGKRLTRNTFNSSAYETVTIPLKCITGQDGQYKVESWGAFSMSEYSCVLLEDLQTKQVTDLKNQSEYNFQAKSTDNPDRFILHLSRKPATCENILAPVKPADLFYSENQVSFLSKNGSISVLFDLDESTNTRVGIYDLQGKKVMSDRSLVAFKDTYTLELPGTASGIYIVTVNLAGSHIVTRKIMVNN
ncbi:MAG: T9SS type A sorting domain-containing protein [Bacteroidia bacterium]